MVTRKTSQQKDVDEVYRAKSADDFLLFALGLIIPSSDGPLLLANCIADFQKECFQSLAPSLHALREGIKPKVRRFWVERTKKSSKDGDLGICILWLIAFAKRPFLIQVCAANQKQAGIIKRRIDNLLHYNPWLTDYVKVQQKGILSTNGMGELIVEASDVSGGAHGETPDLLVLNELVHVARWITMETHMNNANGVPRGVVIVSTNAGIKGTTAHAWRNDAIKRKERWKVHVWNKKAPWLDDEDVEEARRLDPIGSTFKRLWEGQWVLASGDALDGGTIDRSFVLEGPTEEREAGWTYLGGLDLGISKDHSAVAVIGVNAKEQKVKVVYVKGWVPNKPNDKDKLEVNSTAVEWECIRLWKLYLVEWFGYDPAAGGSFMAQRLRMAGVPMREWSFASTQNMTDMAQAFVQLMKDEKIQCYHDEEGRLHRDFNKFSISHKPPSTYKLESVSDEFGHADVGTAVIITLPQAVERLQYWEGLTPADVLWSEDDHKEFSEEELNQLPVEMREIYEDIKPIDAMGYGLLEDADDDYMSF